MVTFVTHGCYHCVWLHYIRSATVTGYGSRLPAGCAAYTTPRLVRLRSHIHFARLRSLSGLIRLRSTHTRLHAFACAAVYGCSYCPFTHFAVTVTYVYTFVAVLVPVIYVGYAHGLYVTHLRLLDYLPPFTARLVAGYTGPALPFGYVYTVTLIYGYVTLRLPTRYVVHFVAGLFTTFTFAVTRCLHLTTRYILRLVPLPFTLRTLRVPLYVVRVVTVVGCRCLLRFTRLHVPGLPLLHLRSFTHVVPTFTLLLLFTFTCRCPLHFTLRCCWIFDSGRCVPLPRWLRCLRCLYTVYFPHTTLRSHTIYVAAFILHGYRPFPHHPLVVPLLRCSPLLRYVYTGYLHVLVRLVTLRLHYVGYVL